MDIFLGILLAMSLIFDIKHRIIPNKLVFPAVIIGFISAYANSGISGMMDSFGALGIALGILIIPFAFNWLGGGDVKLLMAVGVFIGSRYILKAIMFTSVIGGIYGFIDIVKKGALKETCFRLKMEFIKFIFTKNDDVTEAVDSEVTERGIPYAVPITIGTVMALII